MKESAFSQKDFCRAIPQKTQTTLAKKKKKKESKEQLSGSLSKQVPSGCRHGFECKLIGLSAGSESLGLVPSQLTGL